MEMPDGWKKLKKLAGESYKKALKNKEDPLSALCEYTFRESSMFHLNLMKEMAEALQDTTEWFDSLASCPDMSKKIHQIEFVLKKFQEWK